MTTNFKINDNYLIVHALGSYANREDANCLVELQDLAWKKSKRLYNFITGKGDPTTYDEETLENIDEKLKEYFLYIKNSEEYKTVHNETSQYLEECKTEWDSNFEKTKQIIEELTGLKLEEDFTVYITHPAQSNGTYCGNNIIAWGHKKEWSNYDTIYLWHEILHAYFDNTELAHALIQFITDNELRVRLNGGNYPPFVGHDYLAPIMQKMAPEWEQYLKQDQKDIMKFQSFLRSR